MPERDLQIEYVLDGERFDKLEGFYTESSFARRQAVWSVCDHRFK